MKRSSAKWIVLAALLFAPALRAQTPCGLLDDGKVYIAPDYTTFAPPPKQGSYRDPVFGCNITRLSNGKAEFNHAVYHAYATFFQINADESEVLLWGELWYVIDLHGKTVVPPGSFEFGSDTDEPRWDRANPNVIYYHLGNQLKKATISGSKVKNSLVHKFKEFSRIGFSGGEGDLSEDGDHITIIGEGSTVGVYTFSTDTLGPTATVTGIDNCDMTPNNNVICNHDNRIDLYDQNMRFLKTVLPFNAHADRGRDVNGDEIIIAFTSNDLSSPCTISGNGWEKVRLSDLKKTCLVNLPWWGDSSHGGISLNGWAVISISDYSVPGTASPQLPPNWPSLWKLYMNEILLVRLDGSGVYRLGHHRSRAAGSYWKIPRAAISMDGRYVLFDSDMGQDDPVGRNYADVYLIRVQ